MAIDRREHISAVFECEDDWMPLFASWHETIEDAKKQAAFEYEGIASTWVFAPA